MSRDLNAGTQTDFDREEKTLRLLIEQTAGAVLAFALYTEGSVRQNVTEWLQRHLSVPVYSLVLSPGVADPVVLVAAFAPLPRCCLVFHEVEAAFPKFLGYVNFHREELLQSGHALLFWIREEGLRRIAEGAPDFWAWRSRVFDFRTARPVPQTPPGPHSDTIGQYSAPELEEQVSSLETSPSDDLVLQIALGRRLFALKRYEEAETSLLQAVSSAERANDRPGLAEALYLLGNTKLQQDRLAEAESLYLRALAAIDSGEDASLQFGATLRLARIYLRQGDSQRAYALTVQTLSLAHSLNNLVLLAEAYDQMGEVLFAINNLRDAEQAYRQALAFEQKIRNTSAQADTLFRLGGVYSEMGDMTRAQQTLRESAELFQQSGFTEEATKVKAALQRLAAV